MSKILIADDEADLREMLSILLESKGHIVKAASSGNEAFNLFQKENFDIVLSDFKMPDGNGASLLKRIREVNKDVSFYMMSGFLDDYSLEDILNLGANKFLDKPFDCSDDFFSIFE